MLTPEAAASSRRVLVIGVGNPFAGDDAAGLRAAGRLRELSGGAFRVIEHTGEGAGLMSCWSDADAVVLIDAVRLGREPGTAAGEVHRFDAALQPLPAFMFRHSTHAFGLAEAVELARALGQLPRRLVVYAIGGANFTAGAQLSAAVERRLPAIADEILQEVQRLSCETW